MREHPASLVETAARWECGSQGRCVFNVVRSCRAAVQVATQPCSPGSHLKNGRLCCPATSPNCDWHSLMMRRASACLLNIPESACSNCPPSFIAGLYLVRYNCPLQILDTGLLSETYSDPLPRLLAFPSFHKEIFASIKVVKIPYVSFRLDFLYSFHFCTWISNYCKLSLPHFVTLGPLTRVPGHVCQASLPSAALHGPRQPPCIRTALSRFSQLHSET